MTRYKKPRSIPLGWVPMVIVLCLYAGCTPSRDVRSDPLDALPERWLKDLAPNASELPGGYQAIQDTNLLAQAGIRQNPSFVLRRGDLEVHIRMGVTTAMLGLYGPPQEAHWVFKGLFFPNPEDADKYEDVQESRTRQVAGFRRITPGGTWLLFFACDPDTTYSDSDMAALRNGLARYEQRLKLERLFDKLNVPGGE